jgi:MinD superfamily P-loop ATPase
MAFWGNEVLMKIVVISGKGGTGKTTLATNLSRVMNVSYVDCDVEEPNGHIFLKPFIKTSKPVTLVNPVFDSNKCILCGKCSDVCQFNALAKVLTEIKLFSSLCHGCGACYYACPQNAITEVPRVIGQIEIGKNFYKGILNVQEPMGGPIISDLNKMVDEDAIFDAPPGTSCSVVKTLQDADFALLVTEPTQFGLHDLKLAVELVRSMDILFAIIENRSIEGESMIRTYCKQEDIEFLYALPFSRQAASTYASGNLLIEDPNFYNHFKTIEARINKKMKGVLL